MKETAEKKPWGLIAACLVVLALVAFYVIWAMTVVAPTIKPIDAVTWSSAKVPSKVLPWPSYGESAIGLSDEGVIASSGDQKPVPMASTAKLITALCVLQKYPLSPNQSGPTISITSADVAMYNKYQAEDGSDMLVSAGEQLSEYQMLEAILLPSADNVADSLAIWAFGSLANYSTYANQYLKTNDLSNTHIGLDASGFDPSTTSTASDLVKIGEISQSNPVIAATVAKSSASGLPLVGTINNVNSLLGQDNIIGVKTGNTNQAGGVFLSASKVVVNAQPLTLFTAVMQAPTLFDALHISLPLIDVAQSNFLTSTLSGTKPGTAVGRYLVPWSNKTITAIVSQPAAIDSWGGSQVSETVSLKDIQANAKINQIVGAITTTSSLPKYSVETPVTLSASPGQPSKWWTLLHPGSFIHF